MPYNLKFTFQLSLVPSNKFSANGEKQISATEPSRKYVQQFYPEIATDSPKLFKNWEHRVSYVQYNYKHQNFSLSSLYFPVIFKVKCHTIHDLQLLDGLIWNKATIYYTWATKFQYYLKNNVNETQERIKQ